MESRTLEITLISAKDLNKVNLISKMDVYAVVSLVGGAAAARQKTRTPVNNDGDTSPVWNFTTKFTVDEALARQNRLTLVVKIVSERALGDRDIGEVQVPVKELLDSPGAADKPQFVSYQVRKPSGKPKGQLNLSYKFGEKVSAPAPVPASAHAPAVAYPAPAGSSAAYPPQSAYPPPHKEGGAYPPQAAYPQPPPHKEGGAYPPQAAYPPEKAGESSSAYPAMAYPAPAGYPAQAPYGYGGYQQQPPPQGYGGYPPQGYGGYQQQPPMGYGGYPGQPPMMQPQKPKKNKMGGGLGLGLGAGLLGGLLVGDMISDAGDYGGGFDDGGFDGGFDF